MARIRIETELPWPAFAKFKLVQLFDHWRKSYDLDEGQRTLTALVQKLSVLLPKGWPGTRRADEDGAYRRRAE